MSPCPCGYYGHPTKECTCSTTQILRYQKKISGPLLDRIDIHITVPPVEYEKLSGNRLGEPSAKIRERVEKARERQRKRFAGLVGAGNGDGDEAPRSGLPLQANADMGPAEVRRFCELDEAGRNLIRMAMKQMNLRAGQCPHSETGPDEREPRGFGQDRDAAATAGVTRLVGRTRLNCDVSYTSWRCRALFSMQKLLTFRRSQLSSHARTR